MSLDVFIKGQCGSRSTRWPFKDKGLKKASIQGRIFRIYICILNILTDERGKIMKFKFFHCQFGSMPIPRYTFLQVLTYDCIVYIIWKVCLVHYLKTEIESVLFAKNTT